MRASISLYCALIFTPLTSLASSDCLSPGDVIGASYTITENDSEKKLTILRQTPARVIYVLESELMTRIYENYGNGMVAAVEYFDLESKGVEHEASLNVAPSGWSAIYELFPANQFASMEPIGRDKYKCLLVETAQYTSNGLATKVDYLTEVNLPLQVTTASQNQSTQWQLDALVTNAKLLNETLTRVQQYVTFDYADLGDHEDQEFFRAGEYLKYKQNLKPAETSDGHSH